MQLQPAANVAPADVDNLRATVEGHARAVHAGTRCCCRPLWRPLHLRLDGCTLLMDHVRLALTETCEVAPAPPEELVDAGWFWPWPQPAAPGPALRLTAPHAAQEWLLCAANERQRDAWLTALRTAIELSHGPGSPYHEWALGAALGAGSFGAVRVATHRTSGRRAVCKLVAHTHGPHVREAVLREIAVLRRVGATLPGVAAFVSLVASYDYRGDLLLMLTPSAALPLDPSQTCRAEQSRADQSSLLLSALSLVRQLTRSPPTPAGAGCAAATCSS